MKQSLAAKVVGVVCGVVAFAAFASICIPSVIGGSSAMF